MMWINGKLFLLVFVLKLKNSSRSTTKINSKKFKANNSKPIAKISKPSSNVEKLREFFSLFATKNYNNIRSSNPWKF